MSPRTRARRSLLTGLAVVLPLALLAFAAWQLVSLAAAVADALLRLVASLGLHGPLRTALAATAAVCLAVGSVLAVGEVARHRFGSAAIAAVDRTIEQLPGVGPVYRGLRESRTALAAAGEEGFTDVVLVEIAPETHALGFVLGPSHGAIRTALDDDRVTVFLPLAPNPTLGGHVFHVAEDRLVDADMTVPAALSAVLTLGAGDDRQPEAPIGELYQRPDEEPDAPGEKPAPDAE